MDQPLAVAPGAVHLGHLAQRQRDRADDQVVDADLAVVAERGLELAAEIAANAPISLRGNKRVIRELLAAEARLRAAVERELVELRESCFASEDFREGVRAFTEKRKPRWYPPA